MTQSYGAEAKARLQALLPDGANVRIRTVDADRYGRLVSEIFSQGTNINLSLVSSGHAVAYRQYLSDCDASDYLEAEAVAQQNRLVFWAQ